MKQLIALILLLWSYNAFADTKITALTSASSNASTDLGVIVTNPNSNPVTQKINLGNLTVGKASALATTPNQCNGGNYPLGVDTGGNAANCTPMPTECSSTACSLNSGTTVAGTAIVTTSGLQTLTNKTISSPILTGNINLSGLTANTPLYINGSNYVTSGAFSGNTFTFATTSGTLNNGDCVKIDASGNLVDNGSTCGSGGGGGSGTVNAGTAGQMPYYISNGTAVSPTSNIMISGNNVGIGSATPGNKLDVFGSVRVISGNVGINTTQTDASLEIGEGVNGGINIDGVGSNNGGNADFAITSQDVKGSWDIAANAGSGRFSISDNLSGNEPFYIEPSASNNSVYIKSSGNVGVGSSNPGQKLDVQGTVRSLYFVGNGVGITGISGSISGLTTGNIPKAGSSTTIVNGDMTDASGNIGISSTAPGAVLDVVGGFRVSSTSVFNGNVGMGTSTALNQGLTVQGTIATQGGTNPSYITGANLGIGSTLPGQALDVNGTVRTTGFQLTTGAGAGDVLVGTSVGIGTWMSPSSIGASGGGSISGITALNGNIGISSTAPGQTLDVGGTIRSIATGTSYFGSNVGIATVTPGQALDVQGTVRALFFTGQSGHGLLGAWATGTAFGSNSSQLTTDGIVLAYCGSSGSSNTTINIYSDSSSSPSTLRCTASIGSNTGGNLACSSPVRKGDYYEVTQGNGCTNSQTVYFLPLGS